MIIKHKKIILGSLATISVAGVTTTVLVTVLKKDDVKESALERANKIAKAPNEAATIKAAQAFYDLKFKDAGTIKEIGDSIDVELKNQYQSAVELGKHIWSVKDSHRIIVVEGKQAITNLDQILFIFSNKNKTRIQPPQGQNPKDWTTNEIDRANDEFAILMTIFKDKVIKSEKKLASGTIPLKLKFYVLKQYDLFHIFYAFKQASPTGADFSSYNAFVKDNEDVGKGAFKKYLLMFKPSHSQVTSADLDGVTFLKGDSIKNKGTGWIEFAYAGLKVSKQIVDFRYELVHPLLIKSIAKDKMANEVEILDIDVSKLPLEVSIAIVDVSTTTTDGTTVTVTYKGGKIPTQELSGFTSYQAKATSLLQFTSAGDFLIPKKVNMRPSAYKDEKALKDALKARALTISNKDAQAKVLAILSKVKMTLKPVNKEGTLEIKFEGKEKTKVITIVGFKTQVIFDEEAKALVNAKAKIAALKVAAIKAKPTKKNHVNYDKAPEAKDLHVPVHRGFIFTFKSATKVNDAGNSDVTYTVTIPLVIPKEASKELTFFTVGKFETKIEAIANADTKAIKDVVQALKVLVGNMNRSWIIGSKLPRPFNEVVAQTFGITLPSDIKGTTLTYSHPELSTDGTLIITIAVSKGTGAPATTTIAVTVVGINRAHANAKINDVTLLTVVLPTMKNKVHQGVKLVSDDIKPPSQTDFSFRFKEASAINDKGEAEVTYIVDVAPFIRGTIPKELTFIVGGFETKVEAEVRLANVKIQAVTTTTVVLPTMKNKVHQGVKLVSDDIKPPSQIGFSFSFKEASAINDKGEAEVTYTVDVPPPTKGTTPKELIFTVGGFETKVQATAKAKIAALKVATIKTKPTKKNHVNYDKAPEAKDLHIPVHDGFTFTFKSATEVNVAGNSEVTYTVDVVPSIEGTTTREIIFTVGGFETIAQATAKAKIAALKVAAIKTKPTKKNHVNYDKAPEAKDLHIPVHDGFTFTFKSATEVNVAGNSEVTYTVDVVPSIMGTTPKELIFIVGGFETKIEAIANADTKAIKDVVQALKVLVGNMNRSWIIGSKLLPLPFNEVVAQTFGITLPSDIKGTTLTYSHPELSTDGTLIISIVVSKGTRTSVTVTIAVTVVGINKAHANAKINDVTLLTVVPPTMKNKVHQGVKLVSDDINLPSQIDFSFSFKEASAINDKGEAEVTYIVDVIPAIEGTTPKELIFTVGGFETKGEAEVRLANAKINDVTLLTVAPPTMKTKVHQGVKLVSDDINLPSQIDFSFSFKEASAINDKGEADVTYIVDVIPAIEGTTPKELIFTVGGFETKGEAEVRLANAKINDVTLLTVAPPTKKKTVSQGTTPVANDLNPPTQNGFAFEFESATSVDGKGESTIAYIVKVNPFVVGSKSKKMEFVVKAFL